jgi:transposase-like protein
MQCSCPQCGSKAFKRNGYTRHGKQNHRCLDCGRQFSLDPSHVDSPDSCVVLIDNIIANNLTLESSF